MKTIEELQKIYGDAQINSKLVLASLQIIKGVKQCIYYNAFVQSEHTYISTFPEDKYGSNIKQSDCTWYDLDTFKEVTDEQTINLLNMMI